MDSLGQRLQGDEEAAFAVASRRFLEDPEDADAARPDFYRSSVKVFHLAVDADSTNAAALYHLGAVLGRKSYSGFGRWSRPLLVEAVGTLRRALEKATGPYTETRPTIKEALERETQTLKSLK